MANVTSRDPRKPAVVAAFKQLSGATRISNLKVNAAGLFTATCLHYDAEAGRYTKSEERFLQASEIAGLVQVRPIHYFTYAKLCGLSLLTDATTTRRDAVTCEACKQSDAYLLPEVGS
jgi:hypothetical protein